MDGGWQMSRDWVESPTLEQRCQIVADKLLSALEKENHKVGMLMAAYILKRLPNVEAVELDVQGEIQNNSFRLRDAAPPGERCSGTRRRAGTSQSAPPEPRRAARSAGLPTGQPHAGHGPGGHDVTKVFKVGKAWRFSVYDHASGTWQDSPLIATEQGGGAAAPGGLQGALRGGDADRSAWAAPQRAR
jgi:hypothetical protein